MRILVSGSRTWVERTIIRSELAMFAVPRQHTIIHGGARGADTLAGEIARDLGFAVETFALFAHDWDENPDAGRSRNIKMFESGIDYMLAFQVANSPGTTHALQLARAYGVDYRWWWAPKGRYNEAKLATRSTG